MCLGLRNSRRSFRENLGRGAGQVDRQVRRHGYRESGLRVRWGEGYTFKNYQCRTLSMGPGEFALTEALTNSILGFSLLLKIALVGGVGWISLPFNTTAGTPIMGKESTETYARCTCGGELVRWWSWVLLTPDPSNAGSWSLRESADLLGRGGDRCSCVTPALGLSVVH